MGHILQFLVLSLVRDLHAAVCDAKAGLEQCLPGVEQHRVSSTLLQLDTKSASKTSSRADVLGPPAGKPREKHHLMKSPEAAHTTHDKEEESTVLAWTLIGAVCAVAAALHLVFWPDKDVQRATWKVLSESLIIFCALMFYDAFYKTTSTLLKEPDEPTTDDHHNLPPEARSIVFDLVRFLFVWAAFEGGLVWSRTKSWWKPFGLLGSHMLGFTMIQFFGDLQQREPWSKDPLHSFMLTVLAAVMIWCLYIISSHMLESIEKGKFTEWRRHCREFEDEASGLALGLLLTQTIKFMITGHMPPIHGSPKNKTKMQVNLMYFAAFSITMIVCCSAQFLQEVATNSKDARKRRAARVFKSLTTMTAGWCFLSWGMWFFWNTTGNKGVGEGDVMSARLALVTTAAMGGFCFIFLLNFLTHKGLVPVEVQLRLIDCIGLITGLSWEACINVAMEGIHYKAPGPMFKFYDGLANLLIALLVAPAWAHHILPNALAFTTEEEEEPEIDDSQSQQGDNGDETTLQS